MTEYRRTAECGNCSRLVYLAGDEWRHVANDSLLCVPAVRAANPATAPPDFTEQPQQNWCDHCSGDLEQPVPEVKGRTTTHVICEKCYRKFAKSLYDVENFRGRALDAAKKLQIGGLNRTVVYNMLNNLVAEKQER